MQDFDLTGKVALITGGAGHLGRAMSAALAEHGASVVLASRDRAACEATVQSLPRTARENAMAETVDIASVQSIETLLERILGRYHRVDVLVNNACYATPGYLEELDEEKWERGIDGTINSVYRMTRAVLPTMLAQGGGSIVNIASMYGMCAPDPARYGGETRLNSPANYGAGKAAIIQFTKYIAAYYGRRGIRANSVSPGPFPSPAVQQTRWFIEKLADNTMLGRIGDPAELRGVLLLLASDAGSYITGTNIAVDGGWTSW